MLSQIYYIARSKSDGSYLVARVNRDVAEKNTGYLLLFSEHFEALTYLNTHAAGVADQFAIESIPGTQLGALLKRWNFIGVGIVRDPLLPKIEFLVCD
ncbi:MULTISPECIES: hypothetical protein [unclassified Chroococcidiopsis]|uniref:hypothetical protein n=1 Tax=unclassified Chroococcidiopsis TaxID=2646205 RepID=UPI00177E765B|nr:hypothetical protein [Chroococcidiopsis sp. [FACHB-1243]]MBD2304693.1 hypothetical protein [Chroococcidiopsis sp. [FACHB-1243]]